jgi:hypothetical protein
MKSTKTTAAQKIGKISMVVLGAGMMMGNSKCEQKAPARSLKKIVEMGAITSSPIVLPGGGAFDFQFVANQQIYGVLTNNDHFTLRYAPPIAAAPSVAKDGDANSFLNLTSGDSKMMQVFAKESGKENFAAQYSKTAWCMVNLPQADIAGSVNSFEMIGGGGLSIGFTPLGPITAAITGASFNVEWAQLDLSMVATHPLSDKVLAAANINSKQTKTKIGLGISFGAWSLGPSAYYQTPLANVTKNALTSAVNALDTQMKSEEWYTRVLANHDTHLVIVGGKDVKLEPGDQLLVYNEDYYWEGEPCNSKYLGGGAQAGSAVAKIEIDWVGDEISRGKIIEASDDNAVIGAKVKVFKFHAADYKPQDPGVDNSGATTVANTTPAKQ